MNLKGSSKKVMIIARAIAANQKGKAIYYDYGGCLYPEGLVGDKILYFNHNEENKIIAKGYQNQEDEQLIETIELWKEKIGYQKGIPLDIKTIMKGE